MCCCSDEYPINFDFRIPQSDKQRVIFDIHKWMILRRFYFELLQLPDVPLKNQTSPGESVLVEGERIELSDKTPYISCTTAPDAKNPRGRNMFLVLGKRWLVLVHPEEEAKMRGVACSVAPLLYVEANVEPTAPRILHIMVTSRSPIGASVRRIPSVILPGDRPRPPTYDVVVVFASDTVTIQAKSLIDSKREKLLEERLAMLTNLFCCDMPAKIKNENHVDVFLDKEE
jgi:hypothetical protein